MDKPKYISYYFNNVCILKAYLSWENITMRSSIKRKSIYLLLLRYLLLVYHFQYLTYPFHIYQIPNSITIAGMFPVIKAGNAAFYKST